MLPKILYPITFLKTSDLKRNKDFYLKILNFDLALEQENCIIYNAGQNGYWGFCETDENISEPEKVCLTLVVNLPEDVEKWAMYLKDKGIALTKEPSAYEKYHIYNLFLKDPDGYTIEIQSFDLEHEPRNTSKFR